MEVVRACQEPPVYGAHSRRYPEIEQFPVSVPVLSAVQVILIPVGVISAEAIVGAAIAPGTLGVKKVRVVDQGLRPIEF